jgi:hypothetical protein
MNRTMQREPPAIAFGRAGTPLDLLRILPAILVGWITLGGFGLPATLAQTYVTPMMGGGQTAGQMIHIDLYYDADANVFQARVDDSYGLPELRALEPGVAFDPQAPYAVLNGKAYNSQYGWNVGGFFSIPPGAAIWMEQVAASPGLEVYQDWGPHGSFDPIFGTGGSAPLWKWSGVMLHNTYAIRAPIVGRLHADYHIYFGDADTGSRIGFEDFADTTVRLEWTTVPVDDALTFKFGATDPSAGAPLEFINAAAFVTNTGFLVNLRSTNAGPWALQYAGALPMLVVPATEPNGGPADHHAAVGSCLAVQLVSLSGPPQASLGFWEAGDSQPRFTVPVDERAGTNRFEVSQGGDAADCDPFGFVQGRHFTVTQPGLYTLGFRLVDISTNGPGGGPIHVPSTNYSVYLQAGATLHSLSPGGNAWTAGFGGVPGLRFYLERSSVLGRDASWQVVAGPLTGTNRLQALTDATSPSPGTFYRLRAESP